MFKRIISYSEIEMWISILEAFLVSEVFEIGLESLKLGEMGFVLREVLKALDEEYQTSARNNYCNAKTCNNQQNMF